MLNNRFFATLGFLTVFTLVVGVFGFFVSKAFRNFQTTSAIHAGDDAYNKAAARYQAGDYEAAAPLFVTIARSSTTSGETVRKATEGALFSYRQLGHKAQAANDLAHAEQWYQNAVTIAPGDAQARAELEAVQKQRRATTPAPAPVVPTITAPQVTQDWPKQAAPGTPSTSAADFTRANQASESRARPFYDKGMEALQRGDFLGARKQFLQAVAQGPGSPSAMQAQAKLVWLDQNHPLPTFSDY